MLRSYFSTPARSKYLSFNNYYLTPFRVLHTSVSWWFLIGVWVTTGLPKYLLSILANLNNAVVYVISMRFLYFEVFQPWCLNYQVVVWTILGNRGYRKEWWKKSSLWNSISSLLCFEEDSNRIINLYTKKTHTYTHTRIYIYIYIYI